jgi:hypothetical protein
MLVIGLLASTQPGVTAPPGDGRSAEILHQYTLPPLSLTYFGYTPAELAMAQVSGLTNTDLPAIGSGPATSRWQPLSLGYRPWPERRPGGWFQVLSLATVYANDHVVQGRE